MKRLACGLAMLVSAIVSVTFFLETRNGPLQHWTEWEQTDGYYYDVWARSIVGGDLLCRNVPVPVNFWQLDVAEAWMKKDPKLAAEMAAESLKKPGSTPASLLWLKSLGEHRYYQEPGYQYGIALIYALFGLHVQAVFIAQLLLGVLTVWLVFAVTNRYFDVSTATLAALMCALCAPLLMYQLLLLRDAPICFAGFLLVWLSSRAFDCPRPFRWLVLGMAIGGALILKSIFVVYLSGVLLLVPNVCGWRWKRISFVVVSIMAGVMIMFVPLVIRNVAVGVPPLALAGNAAYAFVQSNSVDYRWDAITPWSDNLVSVLKPSGNSIAFTIFKTLANHDSVWSVVKMYVCKFDAAWHWWARPDNACSYAWRCASKILAWLPVTFTLVSPLALVGLVLCMRRARQLLPLYLLVCTALAPLILFNTVERFRLILLVSSLPFAAWVITASVESFLKGMRVRAGLIIIAVLAVACWTSRSLPDHMSRYRGADYRVMYDLCYRAPMKEALSAGKYDEATRLTEEVLTYAPPFVRRIANGCVPGETPSQAVTLFFASMHYDCGECCLKTGNPAARGHFESAGRLFAVTNMVCAP